MTMGAFVFANLWQRRRPRRTPRAGTALTTASEEKKTMKEDSALRLVECTATAVFKDCSLEALSRAFYETDTTRRGALNCSQFDVALHRGGCRLRSKAIRELFDVMDTDGNGLVDIDEFLAPRVVKELFMEIPGQPGKIIQPYEPSAAWLWKRWRGTVLVKTFKPVVATIVIGLTLALGIHLATHGKLHVSGEWGSAWRAFTEPDSSHPLISRLLLLAGVWDKQLTLATFVITFFVGQALDFWRQCYSHALSVASSASDLNLILAAHAKRDATGAYTPTARALLTATERRSRLLILLFWADTVRRYRSVNSNAGLRILMRRGVLTQEEFALLQGFPRCERLHAVMAWIVAAGQPSSAQVMVGGEETLVELDLAQWMDKCCELRIAYGRIKKTLVARMPLQYMHLVQILVDTLAIETPFAMFARFGTMGIPLAGLINVSFLGLVAVSKSFLDPFGNLGSDVEMQVPVLVRDANEGRMRWVKLGGPLPGLEVTGKEC